MLNIAPRIHEADRRWSRPFPRPVLQQAADGVLKIRRTSARDRLRAAGLDRPATRSIAKRTGHGTDQRLEHPPGTKDGVEAHHAIAAVTAATAPPKDPKAQAPLVDEPPHRAVTAAKRAVDPDLDPDPRPLHETYVRS
jgi:hypothetical protein